MENRDNNSNDSKSTSDGLSVFREGCSAGAAPNVVQVEPVPRPSFISKLPMGNIVLVALICAGLAGVYLLREFSGPAHASADDISIQTKVDQALVILRRTPLATPKTDNLVEKFYYEASQRQIAIDDLGKNPFLFKLRKPEVVIIADTATEDTRALKNAKDPGKVDKEQLQALAKVRRLHLMSTIVSSPADSSSAIISDYVLYTDNTIQGWRIEKISPDSVHLCWLKNKEVKYTLQMPK